MSGPFKLLCLIATEFLLCKWEVPTGSLGMPSEHAENNTDVDVEGDGVADEDDGEEDDGEEDDGDEGEDDGHEDDEHEDDGHEDDRDEDDGHEDDGHEDDGHEDDGHEDDGHEDDDHEDDGHEDDEHEDDGHEDDRDEDCMPPTDSSAPVGLRGYRRYFANDSLIGRPVPCTRDDKICFRHNFVFDPISDRCKPIGGTWRTCGRFLVVVNRTELEHGSGRVLGSCPMYDDPCPGYRMAYDGSCYRKKMVRDVICGCNANLTRHILGDMECLAEPISPISVQQPKEDGSCLIPDLRNPDTVRSIFRHYPAESIGNLTCDRKQGECFTQDKLWVTGFEGCHTLLKQGPCSEDHVVALDLQAATQGRAEGTCVDVRGGCPKGYKRMLFDGQCHEDREIAIEAPGIIVLDKFGRYFITDPLSVPMFSFEFEDDKFCEIHTGYFGVLPHLVPSLPPCGPDDMGGCNRYEVENDLPKPEF